MSFSKLNKLFQSSPPEGIESIEEKYELDGQLGEYMSLAKVIVNETAGSAGLKIANEQVKVFLTQFIPSIIINVTNIYGAKAGGKLLSEIQMALPNTLIFGFDLILDTVVNVVGLSSGAMLGFSEDSQAVKDMFLLLNTPFKEYATKLGYVGYTPKATAGTQRLSIAADTIGQPFNLLSRWVADHAVHIIVSEVRDPYINNTLIPAFELFVDDLLPKRDIESNFDPLMTQEEHTLDVAKKKVSTCYAQYLEFKRNSNILIYFILGVSEELLKNEGVQDYLAEKVAGKTGRKMLNHARTAKEAYNFANDKYALSNTIANWMQEHFEALAQYASKEKRPTLMEHAELFKQALSGKILTKSELDTIKGKWQVTQALESGITKAFDFVVDTVSELAVVKSGRENYKNQIDTIKNAIEHGKDALLESLLNSQDPNQQFINRYIILKNQQLNFKSKDNGLPITPLLRAIETGNYQLVKVLVEHCQTRNFKNKEEEFLSIDLDQHSAGVTALQFAIMKGHNKIAIYLIGKGVELVKPSIIGNATPLMIAAKNGALDVVEALLSSDKVINEIDAKGYRDRTALHYAMKNGHMEIAAKLIAKGADLFLKDANGVTPIGLLYKHLEQGNLTDDELIQKFEKLLATLRGVIEDKVCKLMSDNATYPLVRNYLHLAINIGCSLSEVPKRIPWFNMLFEQNEIKLISKLMHDPNNSKLIEHEMWNAVTGDEANAVSILIRSMAKLNANEITAKLIELTSIKVIESCFFNYLLLETKTSLTLESLSQSVINSIIQRSDFYQLNEKILLHIFNHQIKNGHIESVQLILKKAPKLLDLQDSLLNTPLHYALKSGRYEIAQFLLDQGADITLKNKNNDTPYESWSKNNTFLSKALQTLGLSSPESNAPNDVLAKAFALNMIEIKKQMEHLDKELVRTPEKGQQQKLYESLRELISKDNNDEIRNTVIAKILQKPYSDLGLFSINIGSTDSLILQAILKKDYKLLDVFINALFDKYPYQREDVCQFFMNELLSAPIAEYELIKGLEVLLKLPDNKENELLLLSDKKLRLPSEIAFQNKKYALMEYILNLAPQAVTLAMMDYILLKNLPCAEQVFNKNQELIAQQLKDEVPDITVHYLETVWNRPQNDFNLQLFKTYFLNAPGVAINKFLQEHKIKGYFKSYAISMEQLVSKFNTDELVLFINTQFQFLSDYRKLELLELIISKGQTDKIIHKIVRENPYLLNLQLPELGNKTLLHMAINSKNWELASYLMAKGCLVNLKNDANNTAYDNWIKASTSSLLGTHLSSAKIEQMLQSDSDSEQNNALGRKIGTITIVHLYHAQEIAKDLQKDISQEEKIKIIAEKIHLLLYAPDPSVLNGMTLNDYQQTIRELITELTREHHITLEEIFSYKFPQFNGNTLLHQAISTNNKVATDFILAYPIDLDLQNDAGDTLLHLTIKNADFNLSKYFIEQGASTDLEHDGKKTASQLIESAYESNNGGLGLFKKASLTKEQATDLMELITVQKNKAQESSSTGAEINSEPDIISRPLQG